MRQASENAMSELFEHIDKLKKGRIQGGRRHSGQHARNHAPEEGAKMVVGEAGRIFGIRHDRRLRRCAGHRGIGRRARTECSAAPRAEPGGTRRPGRSASPCGGTIEVFVEPVTLDRPDQGLAFYEKARAHAESGRARRRPHPGSTRSRTARSCCSWTTVPRRGRSAILSWTVASQRRPAEAVRVGKSADALPGRRAGVRGSFHAARHPADGRRGSRVDADGDAREPRWGSAPS